MTRWYPLASADEDFLASAPLVFVFRKTFAAPPQQVWDGLTSDRSIASWGPAIKFVNWTSPRPFGVGTTREVVAPGGVMMREQFFSWQDGVGHAFTVYESTVPLFLRFAENYELHADGDSTRFIWTVAIEPKGHLAVPFRVLTPILKAGIDQIARGGQRHFKRAG